MYLESGDPVNVRGRKKTKGRKKYKVTCERECHM